MNEEIEFGIKRDSLYERERKAYQEEEMKHEPIRD